MKYATSRKALRDQVLQPRMKESLGRDQIIPTLSKFLNFIFVQEVPLVAIPTTTGTMHSKWEVHKDANFR